MTASDPPRLDEAALEQFVHQAAGDFAAAISGLIVPPARWHQGRGSKPRVAGGCARDPCRHPRRPRLLRDRLVHRVEFHVV